MKIDFVGKQLFRLQGSHHHDTTKEPSLLMCNVRIDVVTGSKEVTISSAIRIFNALQTPMIVGLHIAYGEMT
jgi:hypothetical protein